MNGLSTGKTAVHKGAEKVKMLHENSRFRELFRVFLICQLILLVKRL